MTWLWATQRTPPGESLDEVVAVIVGYIRREDSRKDMVREEALRDWGAERIVWEKTTKRGWYRPSYAEMAAGLQPGDTVVVSELCQLAAGARDILVMIARLDRAGVGFASLKEDFCTTTDRGKETLRVITALAEIEEAWLRRREEKVQRAKEAGCYKGRTPLKVDEEKFRAVCAQWRAGELTAVAAMEQMGLKPNTFYRRVRERGW